MPREPASVELRITQWGAFARRFAGRHSNAHVVARFERSLHIAAGGVGTVYFEEVRRHVGVDAAHCYGGFLATLTAWCEHHVIAYAGVPVGTIKRHATGNGRADKAAMVEAMRRRGHAPADDNEADALALLLWTASQGAAVPSPNKRTLKDQA